jgi:Ser/Thr protein kinase RdoA (MazF antagonist)
LRLSQESESSESRGSKEWIEYEMDLLQELRKNSLPVADVLKTKTGDYMFTFGKRIGSIAHFCEGEHVCILDSPRNIWQTRTMGKNKEEDDSLHLFR